MATLAELILEQGRRKAENHRRSGDVRAQMWQNLAQIAGNAVQSYAQEREAAPRRAQEDEARTLQLNSLRADDQARQQAQQREGAFQRTVGSGGKRGQVLESLKSDPELYKRAVEHFDRIDTSFKRHLGDVAASVRAFDDSPEAAIVALDALIEEGFDEKQIDQYRQAIQQNPEAIGELIDGLLGNSPDEQHRALMRPKPKEAEAFTLSPGQQRFGADGQPMAAVPPTPPEPKMREVVIRGPNGRPIKKLVPESELMQGVEQYEAPRQAAQPSYQRIETVDESGNPIIQYMTPEEVRGMGGVRTSPKTTAKASGPATVGAILGEIESLSNKINTQGGGPISTLTGMARRGAASMNLDNDVSEYTALVEGFIPMVARAVGHTGVLTQADVDSVRALFPLPTDNSTLARNKLDRVKRLMEAIQTPPTSPAQTPDPLGIRR